MSCCWHACCRRGSGEVLPCNTPASGGAMAVERKTERVAKRNPQSGFTLLQLVIVVLVVAVIGGMAVFGIVEARGRIRLTNSARLLASYMEKARVDSIRRHAATNDEMAGVTLINPTSYRVR